MKNNPVQDKSPVPGDDFIVLPEPRTAVNICSKDTMNITVSQCSLNVFTNLAKVPRHMTTVTMMMMMRVMIWAKTEPPCRFNEQNKCQVFQILIKIF